MAMMASKFSQDDLDAACLTPVEHGWPEDGIGETSEASSDSESDDDDDDDELTPIEYAWRYGLIQDYLSQDPFRTVDSLWPHENACTDNSIDTLCVDSDMLTGASYAKNPSLHEKWDIKKDTAHFLASVLSFGRDEGVEALHELDALLKLRSLKLEDAVLPSDHEIDILRLRWRNRVELCSESMDPMVLAASKGEGLDWSDEELNLRIIVIECTENEKLEVDVETMQYIRGVMELVSFDNDEVMRTALHCEAAQARELLPLTPPLRPLSVPPSPPRLAEAAAEMELTSTPEDLCRAEAAEIERRIYERDEELSNASKSALSTEASSGGGFYPVLRTPADSSSSPLQRKRLRDLKLETPIMPLDSNGSDSKRAKTVHFSTDLWPIVTSSEVDMVDIDPDEDLRKFITDVVTPFAESAIERTGHEQLVELDTTMRIPVPPVDQIELRPPWTLSKNAKLSVDGVQALLKDIIGPFFDEEKKWGGVSKLEHDLPWSPFPARLGKVQVDEILDDDGSLEQYMAALRFVASADSHELVLESGRLRILESQSGDFEELESLTGASIGVTQRPKLSAVLVVASPPSRPSVQAPSAPSEPAKPDTTRISMSTLLRKRKAELESSAFVKRTADSIVHEEVVAKQGANPSGVPNGVSGIHHVNTLSTFMHLQGGCVQARASTEDSHQKPRQAATAPPAAMVTPPTTFEPDRGTPFAVPEMAMPARAGAIICSTQMMLNRHLLRNIQERLPTIDVVERDCVKPYNNVQSAISEADFSISPSTGLLTTTLQKLKQKALPGQADFFGVRERIETIAVRYETLLVLIAESRQSADGNAVFSLLDDSDEEALADLMTFTTRLDTDVQIYYIADGESALPKWLAAIISRHLSSDVDVKLMHEETMWERLLRLAGLNAYAAQAILAKVTRQQSNEVGSSSVISGSTTSCSGVAEIIQMKARERIERFGPIMGGERVLQRVNKVLDGAWISVPSRRT